MMPLTSALLSRPKNISEEMALALANFCLASLDSETGAGTSAFLLLGSLNLSAKIKIKTGPRSVVQTEGLCEAAVPFSNWLNTGDGDLLFGLLFLQGPGGSERGCSSISVPPRSKTVSYRERVVFISKTQKSKKKATGLHFVQIPVKDGKKTNKHS